MSSLSSSSSDGERFVFLADLHALTVGPDPQVLRRSVRHIAASLVACGMDPSKTNIFVQSSVQAHVELSWILSSIVPYNWLNQMTQFKDKSKKLKAGEITTIDASNTVSLGLFSYPVLQAADILLYQATSVPVGNDQFQHIELCRDIAQLFNYRYQTQVFPLPQHLASEQFKLFDML